MPVSYTHLGLENALHKLEELDGVRIEAQPEALDALAAACGGDMRKGRTWTCGSKSYGAS